MDLTTGISGRVLRFLITGVTSVLVDFGLLIVLHSGLQLRVGPSAFLAFWGSVAVNFTLNRNWVFAARTESGRRQFLRYLVLVAVNSVLTALIVDALTRLDLMYLLAKVISVGTLFVLNFFLYRLWVFREPHGATHGASIAEIP